MYAMQYQLGLPADYDMAIIRQRVASAAHLLDDFDGLGLKAYLIRERGPESPINEYAPFYLWDDPTAMGRFLWGGGGFQRIIASFGRPTVRHWTGVAQLAGPALTETPVAATKQVTAIPFAADLDATVLAAQADLVAVAGTPGVHRSAVAVDPHHWELVHFTLWTTPAPADVPGDRYQVLHVSNPTGGLATAPTPAALAS
jgi:hypothetical protein